MEAEQSLLGGLLIDPEAINRVAGIVNTEDFYKSSHHIIFDVMVDLYEKDVQIDLVTVSTALSDRQQLSVVGGLAYLNRLVDTMPSSAGLESYAAIIKEKSTMRALIDACHLLISQALEPGRTIEECFSEADKLLGGISLRGNTASTTVPSVQHFDANIRLIEMLYHKKQDITGVPTGFMDLDRLTSGLQPSDLIIIAGRPGMGKSALSMNIAHHVSTLPEPIPVGIFSLEMSAASLLMRLMSRETTIGLGQLRTGNITETDWARLANARSIFEKQKLFISDIGDLTPASLRTRARRLKMEHDIGLLIVDYLQLMHGDRGAYNASAREQLIAEISRCLKSLAMELNIPVIAISQLNRAPETREDHRPRLSDLRESGAIEQDADLILFLYREEAYNPTEENKGISEVIIGKQRNGPTGTVKLYWRENITSFQNLYHHDKDRCSA